MSTVKVSYRLSEDARKRVALETGSIPAESQTVAVDLATLTPEQRIAVLCAPGLWSNLDGVELRDVASDNRYLRLDAIQDVPALIDKCAELAVIASRKATEADAKRGRDLAETVLTKAGRVEQCIVEHDDDLNEYTCKLSTAEALDCQRLGVSTAGLDEVLARYAARKGEFVAEAKAKRVADAKREEDAKRVADAKREADRQEKIAWANEYGSDRLKRALSAGHDSGRLYWFERAKVEWPGFTLDYDKVLNFNDRNAAPSVAALDKRDEILNAHPGVLATIVWATAPDDFRDGFGQPARKYERWADDEGDFTEHEAIVVDDPKYDKYLWINIP